MNRWLGTKLATLGAGLALAATLLLAGAASASASTYTMYSCQTASGAQAPMSGWNVALDNPNLTPDTIFRSSCPNSVSMYLNSNVSHADGVYASETFVAPPGTTINGFTIWRAARIVPKYGFYYQALTLSGGQWQRVDGCAGAGQCAAYGNYHIPTDPINHLTGHPQAGTTEVRLLLECGNAGGCPAVAPDVNAVWIYHAAFALEDDQKPEFDSAPSGPLVSGGVLSGTVPVTIGATDQGGGVFEAQIVDMDGATSPEGGTVLESQVLDNSTGTCQRPFVAVVPCPLSANGTLAFNTATLADGTHTLQLRVTDPAGNVASWGQFTVTTVNSPCSPVPAASGMTVRAAFAQRSHGRTRPVSRLTLGFSQRPTAYGVVIGADNVAVADAPVCVAVRDDYAGAPLRQVASLTTNGDGVFSYRLASGPSRTIYFIHRVPGGAVAASVHVTVRVPVEVHVKRRRLHVHQTMVWSGRLPGPIPNGLTGQMQVWRGTFWQTITPDKRGTGGVPIKRNGRWTARYTFHVPSPTVTYKFRFAVSAQSGYPYAAGASRPFKVTVRP